MCKLLYSPLIYDQATGYVTVQYLADKSNSLIQHQQHMLMGEINSSHLENQPSNNGDDDQKHHHQNHNNVADEDVLKFMDSLDSYLVLLDSLSSSLRQGWFDFASARYSMGASRVNSVLLDLKEHSAVTRLEVVEGDEPHFTLCKWVSDDNADSKKMKEGDDRLHQKFNSMRLRNNESSQPTEEAEENSLPGGSSDSVDDQVQKERSKSLAVFGTLVSPKLRAAQSSFETALEKLVEIANVRASMLYAFEQVQEHTKGIED